MSAATVLISVGNYGFTLAIVRLLQPGAFSSFAAGQSILLVLGNGAMAAVPWAVARYIAVEDGPHVRAEAMRFGLRASALQALAAAAVAELVLVSVSGAAVASVTAAGAALMSLVAGPVGYLQGTDRVPALARFRLLEAAVRIGSGLLLVLLVARSPALSLSSFALAGLVMLVISVRACRDAWPLRAPHIDAARGLVRQSARLGAVQILMCMLAALDTVAAQAAGFSDRVTGSYQAAALLGRIPLFVSTALAIAAYTEMARAPDDEAVAKHVRQLVWFYAVVTVPILLACWTVPHSLLSLVIPDSYSSAASLLRYTSVSVAAIGLVNCLTTAHQARGRFRSSISILAPAAFLQPVLLIVLGRGYGVTAFGIGLVALSVVTMLAIMWDARRWLRPPARRGADSHSPLLPLEVGALATVVAVLVRTPVVWIGAIVVLAGALVTLSRSAKSAG